MAMTSFVFDERTIDAIAKLKDAFGVSTNAAVIRRALALAQVAAEQADEKHNVLIGGKDDFVKINIAT
jgi:hypothetical protein